MPDVHGTLRQQLIQLLENRAYTIRDLSQLLKIHEKEIYAHLLNVRRSIKAQKRELIQSPYYCLACDYEFKDRQRVTRPGRCPKCKSGRIGSATFQVV